MQVAENLDGPPLVADRAHRGAARRRGHDLGGVVERPRDWFLQVQRQAGVEGRDREGGVGAWRCADPQHIQVRAVEHLPPVGEFLRARQGSHLRGPFRVHVADGGDLDVVAPADRLGVLLPDPASTDDPCP